jgi:hypothetical protein
MPITLNGSAGVTTNSGAIYDGIQRGTAVAASGTSVDFTSIPSWVKRITVMLNGVSTNGTSNLQIQLGSGSITTSGYLGSGMNSSGAVLGTVTYTTGFGINNNLASAFKNGAVQICNLTSNTWSAFGVLSDSSQTISIMTSGSVALGGTLDRIRITTVNGTDTFDAGSINILYE